MSASVTATMYKQLVSGETSHMLSTGHSGELQKDGVVRVV